MSVINQVLLDLEKRRASGKERGKVPSHVRVLPQATGGQRARWRTALGVVLLVATASWAAIHSLEWPGPGSAERAVDQPLPVVSIPRAVVTQDEAAPSRAETGPESAPPAEMQLAARLSFELSRLPEPLPEPEARPATGAIASARVIGKAPAEARAAPVRTVAVETKPQASTPTGQGVARSDPNPGAGRAAEGPPAAIDKRVRQPTAQQLAEAEFRKATALLHQGRIEEAREGFEAALTRYPGHHGARQALLGVLVETKRNAEAERVMEEGLQLAPHQIGFAMALARLQVDRQDSLAAIATLQESASYAQESGDYLAFLGGLLQRQQRNAEAVEQFEAALRVRPNHGLWLLGLAMSLQALGRDGAARDAFNRAKTSPMLSADLRALAEQQLQRLQ